MIVYAPIHNSWNADLLEAWLLTWNYKYIARSHNACYTAFMDAATTSTIKDYARFHQERLHRFISSPHPLRLERAP